MTAGTHAPLRWIACADDFAYDEGAVGAICELARAGRLTATSALTGSALWAQSAPRLRELAGQLDAGLHLNLTEDLGGGTRTWPLGTLIATCAAGAVDRPAIREAVGRQLDAFEELMGRGPDFVDGHQHVHQFRGVREILLAELLVRYPGRLPWIRSTRPGPGAGGPKARLIAALGEAPLREAAARAGFAQNRAFCGVYGFDADSAAHGERMARWTRRAVDATVFMCHPSTGLRDGDPIGPARKMEYEYLRSEQFSCCMGQAGIALARGSGFLA
jgi:predicted glycoside hydrolase/deacetylase ChbG (UPF0249 family)